MGVHREHCREQHDPLSVLAHQGSIRDLRLRMQAQQGNRRLHRGLVASLELDCLESRRSESLHPGPKLYFPGPGIAWLACELDVCLCN